MQLSAAGIHPHGSEISRLLEKRINRYFTREYQRLLDQDVTLSEIGIRTDEGPMWEETESLISSHYDEQFEFFQSFLDKEYRAYSMAFYGDNAEQVRNSPRSLEQAQQEKFRQICQRMEIVGNERILNIGCGFGSLEQYLYSHFPNLEIISITPSQVQTRYLMERIADPEDLFSQSHFKVITTDFAALDVEQLGRESFDVVCSIGLLEQVLNMRSLFEKIAMLLPTGGRTFHHFITSKIVIPQFLNADDTLIGDYFPGGRIWPFDEMARHADFFQLQDSWFINGMNYWKTLDQWHQLFWQGIDDLAPLLGEERIRHWNDYFSLSKACFAPFDGSLFGNGQYLFRKS